MTIRVAAIGVCHWHSIYDSAYLRHLAAMEDVEIVGVHDDEPDISAHRVAAIGGGIPTFTCYSDMLDEVDPDFVLALGRHDTMAQTAHDLLDRAYPLHHGKADELQRPAAPRRRREGGSDRRFRRRAAQHA